LSFLSIFLISLKHDFLLKVANAKTAVPMFVFYHRFALTPVLSGRVIGDVVLAGIDLSK
jgi:hypothetical protein